MPDVVAENADQAKRTGGMIALLPADPGGLTVEGGDPAADMHVTLLFLGSDVSGFTEAQRAGVLDMAEAVTAEIDGPIDASVIGHAVFAPGTDDAVAVHLIGDSTVLGPLRARTVQAVTAVLGDDMHTQHEPYVAHCTAGYGMAAADLTYTGPVLLDRVVVVLGDETTTFPLRTADEHLGEAARRAYAHGWALSGGPMTDRVRAGSKVATQLLREHAAAHGLDDHILEATIDLGSAEGMWARLFQRREDLAAQHILSVQTAWKALIAQLDVAAAITKLRRTLGLTTETTAEDQSAAQNAAAQATARELLHAVVAPTDPAYKTLVDHLATALKASQAEGVAGGIAIAAEPVAIDFGLAFNDAYKALGDLATYWPDAGTWIGKIVNGAATDLGNALARVAAEGGSFTDMTAAAEDVLASGDARAVATLVDMAMSQSFSRGALDLYGREGVQTVDFITAGSRVCAICLANEAKNPWPRAQVPQPALHPHCRCVIAPADPLEALRSVTATSYFT